MGRGSRARRDRLDIYLLPAVIGEGLGDVAEVRDAGRRLVAAGLPVTLLRLPGHPLPAPVAALFRGEAVRRLDAPSGAAPRALTVAPMWGVSAAAPRAEPLGRGGDWAPEVERIEAAYAPEAVVHVSLEEFARTGTAREESLERYREAGVPLASARRHLRGGRGRREIAAFRTAYRRFRAFDRPNLLHLFAGFGVPTAFAREWPEAVPVGPLWPGAGPRRAPRGRTPTWLWYASPASAGELIEPVRRALARAEPPRRLIVRGRPGPAGVGVRTVVSEAEWRAEFASAEMRIVTGSRSLLDAIALGRPFLYFNGRRGRGRSARRHRPEKIRSLLAVGRSEGWDRAWLADLEAFSRGQRIAGVVARATSRPTPVLAPPAGWRPRSFRPPFDDAGSLLVALARSWAASTEDAPRVVAAWRERGRRAALAP